MNWISASFVRYWSSIGFRVNLDPEIFEEVKKQNLELGRDHPCG